ncbi:amino acid ABC transporter ATP-binding protein [Lactobacillus sp. Sy-1]|uniref:amino acid ABC transporter ATP-binding protein n=1 Tax=Lactobacillus sp. Sy-1 TaxID=2109645 RepID=UPI001C58805C|nr:ATP-binding cassette domain-containing protein [Lactobacillus sp. Sy-1]MBW1605802.1 amino acid ABC transporter ATP-binding protein [Lactobacillus sp. Sy-1]
MLELKNITKKYGNRTIINDLTANIKDNEIMCIVGPSGAGKTTLLRCISGLEKIDGGQFILDGKQFDPTTSENNVVGVVFQDFQLFPNLTVMQNITLAPELVLKQDKQTAQRKAQELINQLNLDGKESLYPYQLSGGQKQRVAIVRALAMNPKIICYDEPTSALDPNLRDEVARIIIDLKKTKVTQIVITHDMDFAKKVADNMLQVQPIK